MQSFKINFFVLAFLATALVYAKDVYQLDCVAAKVKEHAKQYNHEDILVLFDINGTLTKPTDMPAWDKNIKFYSSNFKDIIPKFPGIDHMKFQAAVTSLPASLIHKQAVSIVSSLQDSGVMVLGLVKGKTGYVDGYGRLEHIRYEKLKNLGIDFSKNKTFEKFGIYPKFLDFRLTNAPRFNGNFPVIYKGIINSNSNKNKSLSKGAVLVAFLKSTGLRPRSIIMVDDKQANLESVEKHVKSHLPETKFTGLRIRTKESSKNAPMNAQLFEKFWRELVERALSRSN